MEALMFSYPGTFHSKYGDNQTSAIVTVLFVVFFLLLDIFLPNNQGGGEGNGEQQDNQENAKPDTDGKTPNVDDVKSMNFMVAINFIIIWIAYMMEGMCESAYWKYIRDQKRVPINILFRQIFRMATLQYVYGMYAMSSNPPFWLYLVLLLPQAILYSISLIISYYVNDPTTAMYECRGCFKCILTGSLLYMGFKMLYEFQNFFRSEPDLKNKLIQGGVLALGYLWMIFVAGIDHM